MTQSDQRVYILPVKDIITAGKYWDSKFNVAADALKKLKPSLGLMLVAPGMYFGRKEGRRLEREIAVAYGKDFAQELIAVGCNVCLTENATVRSCDGPGGPANGALGLFLSGHENLGIRVAHDNASRHRYAEDIYGEVKVDFVDRLIEKLEFGDKVTTKAVIIFANSLPPLKPATQALLDDIQKRRKEKQFPVWGGYTNDDISIAKNLSGKIATKDAFYVVLRLTGSDLQSRSTLIRCTANKDSIDTQLAYFRQLFSARRSKKRHTLLLISGPVYPIRDNERGNENGPKNCKEFKELVRHYFPETPIMGMFGNMPYCIGSDSRRQNDYGEELLHENCMSLMILAYD